MRRLWTSFRGSKRMARTHAETVLEFLAPRRGARRVLALLGAAAFASAAHAADLSPGYNSYYKVPTYAPAFGWGGFYLGLNGGGGWGSSTWDRAGDFNLSGGVFG